jgi:hypothetical protein
MMNELRPMQIIFDEKCTPFYMMKDLGRGMLGKDSRNSSILLWDRMVICFHIIPSSPMPGKPALTPNPKPTAAM